MYLIFILCCIAALYCIANLQLHITRTPRCR
jgi:hypothetical protein